MPDYVSVIEIFISLRGKGASLSSLDMEVLHSWKSRDLSSDFLCELLLQIADECEIAKKKYPSSLIQIHQKIKHIECSL